MSNIDWDFIQEREARREDAYIDPRFPEAGVTIGVGFDLGQWELSDIKAAGLSANSIAGLAPFMGLKGTAAAAALREAKRSRGGADIVISDREIDLLKNHGRRHIIGLLRARFDANRAPDVPPFDQLPAEAQTVLASVAWQYGPALPVRTPRFWAHLTSGDFAAAVRELEAFGDAHPSRRRKEAALLERLLRPTAESRSAGKGTTQGA